MPKNEKIDPIRETTKESIDQARTLVMGAEFASIAVLEPETGYPQVSRISVNVGSDFSPIFLASDLSGHSKALQEDSRASIMFGEPPAKGDPLAFPRVTLLGKISKTTREDENYSKFHDAWLKKHPKAQLYINFGDFNFYKMEVERVALNGGFGKAFEITAEEYLEKS